jgi:acyl-CoA reductase-like NAD-dependent aldehyde dehydrogenase
MSDPTIKRKVLLPYDGSAVGEFPETPLTALPAIAAAAQVASRQMAALTREQRSLILRRAHAAFIEARETLAHLVAQESGKPLREARTEADRAASTLLFSSEEAHRLCGEEIPMDASPAGAGRMALTIRQPLGVIAAITPFNFPLNLSMHKIGPALAAGNAVLHKPASATTLTALKAAEIFQQSGLPANALQVLAGPGATLGDALVGLDAVRMITFTGSAEVGLRLKKQAGLRRLTLELGNNSGVIVCADADLDLAVPACVAGAFANSGQTCISVQRVYVARDLYPLFLARFLAATEKLKVGHPLDEATEISSLINEQEARRVEAWIAEALAAGAVLHTGGQRQVATITPAVLSQVPTQAKLSCQEAFGPVVCIEAFDTLDAAIAQVNDSPYGLQAGVFTRDLATAFHAARHIHCGGVMINDASTFRVDQMPYGGVKQSGTGREGPRYAIEEMTELKLISWRL